MAAKVESDGKTNTFDPKRAEAIIKKIEREHEGLLSERMSYMSKCRPYRERIAQAYEEGVGFSIPKSVLKAKIKERDLKRKIDCIAEDFEDEERETFEQLTQALGGLADLPLGKAAASMDRDQTEAGKPRRGRPRKAPSAAASAYEDEPDLRSDAQKLAERDREEEAARAAAENRDRLEAGISGLN